MLFSNLSYICHVKRTENKQKEARFGPFLIKTSKLAELDFLSTKTGDQFEKWPADFFFENEKIRKRYAQIP